MDIHKPKPWRGFREFLKEYFIIVVGVLTALGAEQVVQQIDWNTRVKDAEGDMQAELHENARAAFARLTTVNCATAQIEARRNALISNREGGAPVPRFSPYRRSAQLWSTDAWESAHSLQLTGHLPTDRMQRYGRAFAMAAIFRDQQRREQELKPGVDMMSTVGAHPSPMERDRQLLALQELEEQSNRLDNA
ncbi:MAG TPA: hypothetical protein VFN88_13415, partial [Caulobacteraceae bacterium]|nr:hypothetical protein [Caulobacteraceae bacterium]